MTARLPVVYIGGWGRSGSTLLEGILNELPGFVSVGELRTVWIEWDDDESAICTCGATASQCSVWGPVLGRVFDRLKISWSDARALHDREGRTRHFARALNGQSHPTQVTGPTYRDFIVAIYEEVLALTGATTIVDSSKAGTEALLLANMADRIDLRVLHLVRDPRATAHAWSKVVSDQTLRGGVMPRFGATKGTAFWLLQNGLLELVGRRAETYLRVRYEDLISDPVNTLGRICTAIGGDPMQLPLVDGPAVELGTRHVLAGNPGRSRLGRVALLRDDEWMKTKATARTRWAGLVSAPVARRYGYGRGT